MFSDLIWLSDAVLCFKYSIKSYSFNCLGIIDNIKYYRHLLGMQTKYYINSPSTAHYYYCVCVRARVCDRQSGMSHTNPIQGLSYDLQQLPQ